jgi:hypothetical protein
MNILPGTPLRKQVRKVVHEDELRAKVDVAWDESACGPWPKSLALIFCFGALSRMAGTRPGRKVNRGDAHDSLQIPVKYEGGIFQSHRQIPAVV